MITASGLLVLQVISRSILVTVHLSQAKTSCLTMVAIKTSSQPKPIMVNIKDYGVQTSSMEYVVNEFIVIVHRH